MIRTRNQIIEAGVRNLKKFVGPSVNKNNILTDLIFKIFFQEMLEEAIQEDPTQTECKLLLEELRK